MRVYIKSILLGICIVSCWLGCPKLLKAQEILVKEETDTSIIYDMGMLPAIELPIKELTYENPLNPYNKLKTPAQITKKGDYYFIVDTYHDQVLFSRTLETPVKDWKVMTSDVDLPHAIESDGKVYLVADTENNRVLVFEWKRGRFQNTQCLNDIGIRPHYIEYDEEEQAFYVWSSMTGEMYIMKRDVNTGIMCIQEKRQIKELADFYVRSFALVGDDILFPSGNNSYMIIADKKTFEVKGRFPVTQEIAGMAFVKPIGNYFYITVSSDLSYDQSQATVIRTKDLNSLAEGEYEELYELFSSEGIPYYIDYMNGLYYMTSHGSKKSIWRFAVKEDNISYVGYLY